MSDTLRMFAKQHLLLKPLLHDHIPPKTSPYIFMTTLMEKRLVGLIAFPIKLNNVQHA